MVTTKTAKDTNKPRAVRLGITQLVVLSAFEKVFSTGSHGWFGQVLDPSTGTKYQITGAVAIKAK